VLAPFGTVSPPPRPQYSRPEAWGRLPDVLDLTKLPKSTRHAKPADVFFVHPTTFVSSTAWNADVGDAATNAATDADVLVRQAGAFDECCRVYAPRYRQASTAALFAPAALEPQRAYELAYEDVSAAFEHYLATWNDGRPLILAGHSQGTLHVERLLRQYADDPRVRDRLVVAYAVGLALPVAAHRNSAFPPCETPAAVRCIVSWNTYANDGDGSAMVRRALQRHAEAAKLEGAAAAAAEAAGVICVNPLTFSATEPTAPASLSRGALPKGGGSDAPTPIAGAVAAQCRNGILYVDVAGPERFALRPLAAGGLHFNDYDLYYADVSADAVRRVRAFVAAAGTR
jgi:hypothetical protein